MKDILFGLACLSVVVLIACGIPCLGIWAINTLAGTTLITHSFINYVAMWGLILVLNVPISVRLK